MRVFALGLVAALALAAGDVPRPAVPLTVKTFDGKTVSLEQLRGKVVAVMFFLTTCPHCQKTVQLLNPIYEKWKPRGLEILALAIDRAPATDLEAFATKYGVKFPLGLSTRSTCTEFAQISVMSRFFVPYMFFVDRQGQVREEHPGQDREFYGNQSESITTLLDNLLKEPST